jgi:hypothetical protein
MMITMPTELQAMTVEPEQAMATVELQTFNLKSLCPELTVDRTSEHAKGRPAASPRQLGAKKHARCEHHDEAYSDTNVDTR